MSYSTYDEVYCNIDTLYIPLKCVLSLERFLIIQMLPVKYVYATLVSLLVFAIAFCDVIFKSGLVYEVRNTLISKVTNYMYQDQITEVEDQYITILTLHVPQS